MINILWRNIKWRFQNPITIVITILQPLIWLALYGVAAGRTMQSMGITNYTAFILPGIIMLVTFSACSSGGMFNYITKTNRSYYRILIAPVSRTSIVLGQMLEAILLTFIETAIMYSIAFLFSLNIASGFLGILLMILIIFLASFFISGLAYSISLILPNEAIYETAMNAIVLPIFFLSTALFPLESFSGGIKNVILLNPFTHIINVLRSLITQEKIVFGSILAVIGMLIVLCAGSFMMAMWRLNKETAS